jgi:hypothetical protein
MPPYGRRTGIEHRTQGERHYGDPRGYLKEVDALRGEPRLWFFWIEHRPNEPGLIRRYLKTIGHQLERIPDKTPGQTGAILYDLSDPEQLTTAEAFSLN